MSQNLDRPKVIARWTPILESLNVKPENKEWMAEMAEIQSRVNQQMNENAFNTISNGYGVGNIVNPQPSTNLGNLNGSLWANGGGTLGSGDIAQTLTPTSLRIASQIIGLDLIPTLPANSPSIQHIFVDFPYEDGRLDAGHNEKPTLLKLTYANSQEVREALMAYFATNQVYVSNGVLSKRVWMNITTGALTLVEPTSKAAQVELLGFSFYENNAMIVRSYKQANTANAGGWTYDVTLNTFANNGSDAKSQFTVTAISGVTVVPATLTVGLVSTMEDHVPGYVSNFEGTNGLDNMTRLQDENRYPNTIGITMFSKAIAVGDDEVSTYIRRTELEDIPNATGINVMNKMESVLSNELTQKVSRKIVEKIRVMGEKNRENAPRNTTATPHPSFGGFQTIFDLNTEYSMLIAGESTLHVQRKLATAIDHASLHLFTKGRINKASYLITNATIATALRQLRGFFGNDIDVQMSGSNQLAPFGSINGIKIYVDPYQEYWDNRITLGCKNKTDQPGLVFVPYLMAQKIEVMSEATNTQKITLRSRYTIADIGFNPERQYMTLFVADDNGLLT